MSFYLKHNFTSYWSFDGSDATDLRGANTLTNVGTVTFEAGKVSVAAHYNGSSQYHNIADASQTGLDITGNMTITGWVNFDTLPGSGAIVSFVSKFRTDGTQARSYQFGLFNDSGTQKLIVQIGDGTTTSAQAVVAWTPVVGTWYHVAMVYTAAGGTADFYVNGAAQGAQQSGLATSIGDGAAPFRLGASANDTPSQYLDGLLDEVNISPIAHIAADIAILYAAGSGVTYNNLSPYLSFASSVESQDETILSPISLVTMAMSLKSITTSHSQAWANVSKSSTTWTNQSKS